MTRLDAVFAPGPSGFLGERLRAFVVAVNPELPAVAPPAPPREPADPVEPRPAAAGADAWQAAAQAYAAHLWSGDSRDFERVWGVAAPAELVAFEDAVRGANLYSTFKELRLDVSLMADPPPDKNLFEMLVLGDQLNYLGTALPEAFAGVACFGMLGNGDTYHLEVYDERSDNTKRPRSVVFWDHEEHHFAHTFADSIESLAYLAALSKAVDDELVSPEVAAAGFAALRGHVAPSWHFSIDDHDAGFTPYKPAQGTEVARFMAYRAQWIVGWFRQDGVTELKDLARQFFPKLNGVLPAEHVPARLDACKRFASTALYAMWRAYLFDEPELEQLLAVGRAHAGRLVRDAAKLIDELRAGRNQLGKIADVQRLLARFRALDLDPRRAAERDAEAAARAAEEAARHRTLVGRFAEMTPADLEAYAWDSVTVTTARDELLGRATSGDVREAIAFLVEGGYARHNQIYRDEEYQACAVAAAGADATVQAVLLGEALAPQPKSETPRLGSHHAWEILFRVARAGRLDPRALPHLRAALAVEAFEDHVEWRLRKVADLVGLARDRGSVPALAAVLAKLPAEGEFETAMKYDELIGDVAIALRRIGDPAGADALVPFAASTSLRMRHARTEGAYAIARLAPERGTQAVLDGMLDIATKINASEEDSLALVAYGLIARAHPAPEHAERLAATDAMAKSYVEVQLAKAVALHLLGGPEAPVVDAMTRALTEPGWKPEYTVRRRRWAIEMFELMPLVDKSLIAGALELRDEVLTGEALAVVGGSPPRTLTWFEAKRMTDKELAEVLADAAVGSRHHAARVLAQREPDHARGPLERALLGVVERAPATGDLSPEDDRIAREAVRGLRALPAAASTIAVFDRMLRHANREVKDPVLRDPPDDPSLVEAMRLVVEEKYGWQENTAREWLVRNGG